MVKSIIETFLKSLQGQFIIGGLTVAGIAYFSNNLSNAALSGIIGALPVGMPSSVFVDDSKVEAYALNLLIMSVPLFIATFTNWFFISKMKFSKYKSVGLSMCIFLGSSLLLLLFK
jgi:hypothetical protein